MEGFNFTRVVTGAATGEKTVRVDTEPRLLVVDEQGHLPIDFNTCSKAKKKRKFMKTPVLVNYLKLICTLSLPMKFQEVRPCDM